MTKSSARLYIARKMFVFAQMALLHIIIKMPQKPKLSQLPTYILGHDIRNVYDTIGKYDH